MQQKMNQKMASEIDELQIANEDLRMKHELAFQENTVLKTTVKKQKKKLRQLNELQSVLD